MPKVSDLKRALSHVPEDWEMTEEEWAQAVLSGERTLPPPHGERIALYVRFYRQPHDDGNRALNEALIRRSVHWYYHGAVIPEAVFGKRRLPDAVIAGLSEDWRRAARKAAGEEEKKP